MIVGMTTSTTGPPFAKTALAALAETLRSSPDIAAKRDIAGVVAQLGLTVAQDIPVGDDCAAIPDGDGFLLFAIEGFMREFVDGDPWFAGWCGVMVNVSDIAAMGGRPIAIIDCLPASKPGAEDPVLTGLKTASEVFGVPIVGGHTNRCGGKATFSAAILGRAKRLITSFDAMPGDRIVVAIDLRGRYREPYPNWEAATSAPPAQVRAALEILPQLAEAGLVAAGKDISQAGIVGTLVMLAECSRVGATLDILKLPKPHGVPMTRWLQTFPSYGFILAVSPANVPEVMVRFASHGVAAADVGSIDRGDRVAITDGVFHEPFGIFPIVR